ncbi:MAG: C-type lectin domain-containing protein [Clostridia bacterium]|nr:C-type lectin domain-containing protein [Clostridia bacterium]
MPVSKTNNRKWAAAIVIADFFLMGGALATGIVKYNGVRNTHIEIEQKYNRAITIFESAKEYMDIDRLIEAEDMFTELDTYLESRHYVEEVKVERENLQKFLEAERLLEAGKEKEAAGIFHQLGNYHGADEKEESIYGDYYDKAVAFEESNESETAVELLSRIPEYSQYYDPAQKKIREIQNLKKEAALDEQYQEAEKHYTDGHLELAQQEFMALEGYRESEKYLNLIGEQMLSAAKEYREKGYHSDCKRLLEKIDTKQEYPDDYGAAVTLLAEITQEYRDIVNNKARSIYDQSGYGALADYMNMVDTDLYPKNMVDEFMRQFGMEIPDGASVYNGHMYMIYNIEMSWQQAQEYCESKKGHLVTITDAAEQEFIEKLNKDNRKLWIGGYRHDDDPYTWYWVTGEPWNYSHWGDGEPNNYSGSNETRASVWPEYWNDLKENSSEQSGFICEWDYVK